MASGAARGLLRLRLPYLSAEDDHDLVWGRTRGGAGCTDELCECHTAPVIGERRD
jgi:hypothetical protein